MPQAILKNQYMKNGKPILLLSWCAYIDILGFKQTMSDAFDKGKGQQLLNKLHVIMLNGSSILRGVDQHRSLMKYKIFTDNIVVGCPIRSGSEGEEEFGHIITWLILNQLSMTLEGFFVRGGLTVGQLHIGTEIAYGEALLEAYEIEENIAKNPRIVFSDRAIRLVNKYIERSSRSKDCSENKEILKDSDNQYFVNYLGFTVGHTYINWKAIERHRQNVKLCLKKFKNESDTRSKYRWVANYHDYFCELIKEFCGSKSGYNDKYLIGYKSKAGNPGMLIEDYLDYWLNDLKSRKESERIKTR